jgi:hypothetical protein
MIFSKGVKRLNKPKKLCLYVVNSLLILFTNKKPLVNVLKKKDGIKEVNASIRLVSVLFSEKSNFFQAKQKAKKQLRKRRLHAGLFWSVKDLLLNPSPTKTNRFFLSFFWRVNGTLIYYSNSVVLYPLS